jgi:hypothetical protein
MRGRCGRDPRRLRQHRHDDTVCTAPTRQTAAAEIAFFFAGLNVCALSQRAGSIHDNLLALILGFGRLVLKQLGEKRFRAKTSCFSGSIKGASDFARMTDLARSLRETGACNITSHLSFLARTRRMAPSESNV